MEKWKWIAVFRHRIYPMDGYLVVNVGPFDTKEQLIAWCNAQPELKDAQVSIQCLFPAVRT